MPLPSLEELVENARREIDSEFERLRAELEQAAAQLKRKRLEELDKTARRFVEEIKRLGG